MNILLLCNKLPWPPNDGGSLATYNMAKGLAGAGNRVDVLAMRTSRHSSHTDVSDITIPGVDRVYSVFVDNRIKWNNLLINLFNSSLPYNASMYINEEFRERLVSLLRERNYDVVQLEGLYLAPYLRDIREFPGLIMSYRAHNIEHRIWERFGRQSGGIIRRFYVGCQAERIRNYEQDIIDKYDLLVAISSDDLEIFDSMGNSRPSVVAPFGVDNDAIQCVEYGGADELCLQFIGALDWMPNVEALEWFIDNVWESLRFRRPGLKFYVAGRNAGKSLVKKLTACGIDFLGEVENASGFISQPGILVVPLFSGSGIRVRIIEAMWAGKAVVASPAAISGIPADDGKHLIVAEDGKAFTESVERLLDGVGKARVIGNHAREFALKYYNNGDIARKVADFYKKHIG
ncbi:MAG: glycosyltransferase [Marinilabiliales bacterium]|nr:MAG: glycosyltransferase [Marinilabiliales bacterium]